MSKKYTIEVTAEQAEVISKATDFYSRIACGQFQDIYSLIACQPNLFKEGVASSDQKPILTLNKIGEIDSLIQKMKSVFGPSLGILGPLPSESSQVAWDVHQVIRHRLAWDREPEGGIQVSFDEPYFAAKSSRETPPVIAELIEI